MLMHFNQERNRIIRLVIYLLICSQNVETLTDQLTELGQHVTINCDLDENEVYWLLLNLPDPPVTILRLFSTSKTPFYYNMKYKHKYSIQSKHLSIKNVTTEELGVYYCMNTGIRPTFSSGTRLHIIEPTQLTEITECQNLSVVQYVQLNQTVTKYIEQNETREVFLISGLLGAILVFVGIGFVHLCTQENIKCQKEDLQQTKFLPLKQLEELKSCKLYTEVVFTSVFDEVQRGSTIKLTQDCD